MDKEETVDTDLTNQDDAQIEQSADDEQSDITPSEQSDEDKEEKLYAGKFKSDEELEKAYKELEKKLGGHTEIEEKAKAFDRLVRQRQTPAPVSKPRLSSFVDENGQIDVQAYDEATDKYEAQKDHFNQQSSQRSAQDASDAIRAERDYPFIAEDKRAQKLAYALYSSGETGSLYEAVAEVADMRENDTVTAKKTGAKEKEREIAKKLRSKTEGAGGKTGGGEVSLESFAKFSLSEKKAYLDSM